MADKLAREWPPDRIVTRDELPDEVREVMPADWCVLMEFEGDLPQAEPLGREARAGTIATAGAPQMTERWIALIGHDEDAQPIWTRVLRTGSDLHHGPGEPCGRPGRDGERVVPAADGGHVHRRSEIDLSNRVTLGSDATATLVGLMSAHSHWADYDPTAWTSLVSQMQARHRQHPIGHDGEVDLLPVIRAVATQTAWPEAHDWLVEPATWLWEPLRCRAIGRRRPWGALDVSVELRRGAIHQHADWLADALVRLLQNQLARQISAVVLIDAATGDELGRNRGVF